MRSSSRVVRDQRLLRGDGEPLAERRRLRRRRCAFARPSPGSECSSASRASRASAATTRSRTSASESRICSCSTFSVRSRQSCPCARAHDRRAAELLDPGLDVVPGDALAGGDRLRSTCSTTPVVLDRPRPVRRRRDPCAGRTASQSRRSSTTLCSGDQRRTSSGDAYRLARTFAITGPVSRIRRPASGVRAADQRASTSTAAPAAMACTAAAAMSVRWCEPSIRIRATAGVRAIPCRPRGPCRGR